MLYPHYLKSIEVNSIESENFIINWVQGPSHQPGLYFVLFIWQQLQLDVKVAAKVDSEIILFIQLS